MARPKPPIPPKIYVDSNIYLDLITMNRTPQAATGRERWIVADSIFNAVNQDRVSLAASALIEAEVCCNGEARAGDERVRKLLNGWFTAPATAWTDVDRFLAREAARLSAEHSSKRADKNKSFSGADAIHMAAAIRLSCGYLMTNDGGFPIGHTIEGVVVMRPDQVWDPELFDEPAVSMLVQEG